MVKIYMPERKGMPVGADSAAPNKLRETRDYT
jgi:hypothetical protein